MLFGFLFILLTVSFALVLIWYMVANDFAKETLDVAYPAIGAMIVSIYLGSKAIYIDAPPPQEFLEGVPILLDFSSGYAHGVPRQTRASLGTEGARAIEWAQYSDEVKALNLPKKLWKEANDDGSPRVAEEIIEYAILTWLAQVGRLPVFGEYREVRLFTEQSGSISYNDELSDVKFSDPPPREGISNRLIAARPVTLGLPPGSTIRRRVDISVFPAFEIRTRHSTLTISIQAFNSGNVDGAREGEAKRLAEGLVVPGEQAKDLRLMVYTFEFVFDQNRYYRFSRQAKTEAAWFVRMRNAFARDFGWEAARKAVLDGAK